VSNPAVITLDSVNSKKGQFKRFVVEDNIGESLHLHIDNMRVDFTVNEFLEFSIMIRKSLKDLDIFYGYDINDFDESFLKNCAPYLHNLYDIEIEKIKISDLKCINRYKFYKDLYLTSLVKVENTSAYKYLKNTDNSFLDYPQYNYFNINNAERLKLLKGSIQEKYPKDNKYIILFNGQNIIMDGQHRVAILADIYGIDKEIDILRFYFKGKKHHYKLSVSNIYKSLYWLAKKVYYRFFKK
jgi:hypothetical protein